MSISNTKQFLCAAIVTLSTATASTSVFAQDQNPAIIYQQGDFRVEEHQTSDMGADLGMCIAEFTSNQYTRLSVRGYQDNFLFMELRDDRWKLKDRDVPVIVNIDGEKIAVQANSSAQENTVLLSFEKDPALGLRILNTASGAQTLVISTYAGKSLAEFSTRASAGAIVAFKGCWERVQTLQAVGNDPFKDAVSDFPFGLTSKDHKGTIFAITALAKSATPADTTGALYRSINRNGADHESFAMFSNCDAYSMVHGWGEWSWSNAGFGVRFDGEYHDFNRGETAPNLGTGCALE